MPGDDTSEWLDTGPEPCAATMVLEADQGWAAFGQPGLDCDRPDQTWFFRPDRMDVDETEAFDLSRPELVEVAEQLVATADSQQAVTLIDKLPDQLLLPTDQIARNHPLITVLPASDVEQVVCRRIESLSDRAPGELKINSSPLTTLPEQQDVATVGIDVHLFGVKAEQSKLHDADHTDWTAGR